MELKDFFGLDFNLKKFEINMLLDLMGLRKKIEQTKQVKQITEKFGAHSKFVYLAKKQQTLKLFKPLLINDFLPYDALYYQKEVNTSTEHDRQYNAEEKLMEFALTIASGMTLRQQEASEFKPDSQTLRSLDGEEHYERLWDVLNRESREVIEEFKRATQ